MRARLMYRSALVAVCLPAVCLLAATVAAPSAFSQPPDTLWTRTYGGSETDLCSWIGQAADGGYLALGSTKSFGAGGFDVYLVRTDENGDTLWTRTYGGRLDEYGASAHLTTGDGCLIVGRSMSVRPDTNVVYVVQVASDGDTLWTRTYGREAFNYGAAVAQAPDGGYLVAGTTGSGVFNGLRMTDMYFVKISAEGESLWTRRYGGDDIDAVIDVRTTSDGGYVVVGATLDTLTYAIRGYLMKMGADGDSLWTRTFPSNPTCIQMIYSVVEAPDGGYLVAGVSCPTGPDESDACLVKTNASGWPLWVRTYGGPGADAAHSIQKAHGGGYILAGERRLSPINAEFYVILTDSEGDTVWTATWGGPGIDQANSVVATSDGGYIIAGGCEFRGAGKADMWLIKTVGAPPDTTPPGLAVGILQNPYLTRYLDIYLVASEDLDSASVELAVNDQSVPMRQLDLAHDVWAGDYKLPAGGGVVSVQAHVKDLAGNDTTVTTSFSALRLGGADTHLSSPDGKVTLKFYGSAVSEGAYFLMLPCDDGCADGLIPGRPDDAGGPVYLATAGARPTSYHICPAAGTSAAGIGSGETGGSGAWLEFHYDRSDLGPDQDPGRLYIEQVGAAPLECYVDADGGTVAARLRTPGTFRLRLGPPASSLRIDNSALNVRAVCPNPFRDGVRLCFDLGARQQVEVRVFDASGRLVATPWLGTLFPGVHEIRWDGTSTVGSPVAAGLYFVRVETEHARAVGKVIRLP